MLRLRSGGRNGRERENRDERKERTDDGEIQLKIHVLQQLEAIHVCMAGFSSGLIACRACSLNAFSFEVLDHGKAKSKTIIHHASMLH